jgi:ABC-type uncharacterized transport system substrate-binding protein
MKAVLLLIGSILPASILQRRSRRRESRASDCYSRPLKNRLPTSYHKPEYIEVGGLMSYGVSFTDLFRRAATYVDKILKGAKPADLPVEPTNKVRAGNQS